MKDAADLEKRLAALARSRPREAVRRAAAAARRERDPANRAMLERAQASALHAGGRYREALRAYARARRRFVDAGCPGDALRLDVGRIDVLQHLGRYEAALGLADGARRALLRAGAFVAAAMADANAAGGEWRRDRPASARRRYDRARAVFAEAGHRFGTAACDLNLGNTSATLDDRDRARRHYALARKAFAGLALPAMVAQVDYNEAFLCAMEDRPDRALDLLASAEAEFRRNGDGRHIALIALDRAEVHVRCGLLEEAAEGLEEAAATFRREGLRAERARVLSLAGWVAALRDRHDRAGRLLATAARLYRSEGNDVGVACVDLYRAVLAARRGRSPRVPARRALAVFVRLRLPVRAASALVVIAMHDGDRASALRALRHLRGRPAPSVAFAAHRVLARDARRRGHRGEAARRYAAALEEAERLRSGLTADEMRIAFLRGREEFFGECARFLLERGGPAAPERALEVVERVRGRALLEHALLGREPVVRRREPAAVRDLRERLRFAYNRMAGTTGDRLRGPVDRGEVRRLEERLARLDRGVATVRGHGLAVPGVRRLLRDIPPDTAVVTYVLDRDGGDALVSTRSNVVAVPGLPGLAVARDLASELRYEMDRAHLDGAFSARHRRRLLEDAHDVLERSREAFVGPVLDAVEARRVVFVPQGPLHGLPFPALLPERTVSVAPGLRFLSRRVPDPARRSLLLGVSAGPGDGMAREARDLASSVHGAEVLLDEAATGEALRSRGDRASVVHVAAHGLFRDDQPLASALLLGDGWVPARRIMDWRLRTPLVVLAACESGRTRELPGEEILGLSRGFLGAGAAAVVAALWRVPDAPTTRLMKQLYDGLGRGIPVDAALREAQWAARRREEHPASWAAFIPVGAAQAASREMGKRR